MNRPARKILLLLLALLLIGVLLWAAHGRMRVPGFSWDRLGEALRGARLDLLLLSLFAIYVCYWIRGLRWVRLSRHIGPAGIWSVFEATLMGFVAIVLLGRAGEPVRPFLIGRRERLSISSMFGVFVVERLLDVSVTIFMTGWSLILLPRLLREHEAGNHSSPAWSRLALLQKAGFALFAGLLVAVVFLMYLHITHGGVFARQMERWRATSGWRCSVAGIFIGFLEGLQALQNWGDFAVAVVLTAAHWSLVLAIYVWVPRSFGGDFASFGLRAAVLTLACTMLGSALQLPVIGGGSWAGTFGALTLFLGVAREPAMAAAVTLWLITFASCSFAGIPLLLREGMSLGELRRIATQRDERTAGAPAAAPSKGIQP